MEENPYKSPENIQAEKPGKSAGDVGAIRLLAGFVGGSFFLFLGIAFLYRGLVDLNLKFLILGGLVLLLTVAYYYRGFLYLRHYLKRPKE